MSEGHRRIRAQRSASDPQTTGFVLDAPVQPGMSARFDRGAAAAAPLAEALFSLAGVNRIEASDRTIWVRTEPGADWAALKPAIAGAIRQVLDATDAPLGADAPAPLDADAALLEAVRELLEQQVNPAVAGHGGHISADRVEGGVVHLRMSGGCQGCAASAATLQQGVERMLRAALPQIAGIVDVTDHGAGQNPFYTRETGASPLWHRPVPPGVIDRSGGQVTVDPEYLAPRLGLTPEALRRGLQTGDVVGVTETGKHDDAGRTRIVLRSAARAWAAELLPDGSAREIPPPRQTGAAADREQALAKRLRAHLAGAGPAPVTYGELARTLGLVAPGSIGRITRALETTMREDAEAGRPFIAARAVGRGPEARPGRGFFELAAALSRGARPGETDADLLARERAALDRSLAAEPAPEPLDAPRQG